MGFIREGTNEVIATTAWNAAPMGIHYRDGEYSLVLFAGSHTSRNVERDPWIIANFVFDPVIYVQTAFGDLDHDAFTEETVNGRSLCRLTETEAWIAFSVRIEKRTPETMKARLTPEKEVCLNPGLHPVNRGFNSIIEATVHATRFILSHDPNLKKLINHHAVIVRKCGGTREMEALELLMGYIG
jgi:hypothetical protein